MSTMLTNPRTGDAYAQILEIPSIIAGRPVMSGHGSLSGVVRVAGAAAARTVEVLDDLTLTRAAEVVSAGDGTWSISGLTTTRALRLIVHGDSGERDVTIRGLYAVAP